MKYKQNDIPYLGCNEQKIKQACPELNYENFKHLHRWIIDRYHVHILKDIEKKPAPWTDNPIIQEYRFTNVRREHDKETQWVIHNICSIPEKDMSLASKICNLILFRVINKSETCKHFMPINFDKGVDWNKIYSYIQNTPKDYVYFTNVFYCSGMKNTMCKAVNCVSSFKDPENGIPPLLTCIRLIEQTFQDTEYMKGLQFCARADNFVDTLQKIPGIGKFLSYQIFVDYTYCKEALWSENEYVYAGPGAKRGLNYIFKNKDGMSYEECLFWLRDHWEDICDFYRLPWNPDEIFTDLPEEDRYMNVMSLQNCHCEISKYIRAITNTGRPRNKYRYREETNQ